MSKSKAYLFSISLFVLFLVSALTVSAGTVRLPQTGQTKCYDTAGTEIPCAGTGQDGDIRAGVAWPNPRFHDNGDGTVTDNLTGLMWAKDANLTNGYRNWQEALDYVVGMNSGSGTYGYTDWRLPNENELASLVNADAPDTAAWLNTQGFSNVQSLNYWSSSTYASSTIIAWYVGILRGSVTYDNKDFSVSVGCVWPVRAGQSGTIELPKTGQTTSYETGDDGDLERGVAWPNPRFADNGNGTVTDNLTGLMWSKNANFPNGFMRWQSALDFIASLNRGAGLGGYYDWHLPNRNELRSLVDYSKYWPAALPTSHPFTNVQSSYYWSSSTIAYYTDLAWSVNMRDGDMGYGHKDNYGDYYVWPVRAGQIEIPTAITLSSFTAETKGKKAVLNWETETEIDNIGFNILRSETENGEYVKINKKIIKAKGSATKGASYNLKDKNVKAGKTYFYKLEDIDSKTGSTVNGPVNVEVTGSKKKGRGN